MRVLNLFTYDYPFEGNDQNFIEDEIKMLSTLFDKINIEARSRWPLDKNAPYMKGPGLKL